MNQNEEKAQGLNLLKGVNEVMAQVRPLAEEIRRKEGYNNYLIDLKEEIKEPVAVLSLDGMTLCSEGNISTIVGEAKSRKTYLCSALVAGFLHRYKKSVLGSEPHPEELVLWVDTEQSKAHVQQLNKRILEMARYDTFCNHTYLKVLALRELTPELRTKVLFEAVNDYKPKLLVIDGVSDLLKNTNDLEESERLVGMLMATSSRLKNHILMVLHTNPNSDKARGHIGSALQRKSESVVYVRKVGECSVVEPQFTRNEPFDRFAFRINAEGMPESCPVPDFVDQQRVDRMESIRRLMRETGGYMSREMLIERLRKELNCSKKAASMRVMRAVRDGVLLAREQGKELALIHTPQPQPPQGNRVTE